MKHFCCCFTLMSVEWLVLIRFRLWLAVLSLVFQLDLSLTLWLTNIFTEQDLIKEDGRRIREKTNNESTFLFSEHITRTPHSFSTNKYYNNGVN